MTNSTNMICVGGPMHGQRKQVQEGCSYWECVERPRLVAGYYISRDPPDAMETIEYKRHLYEREVIGSGERRITFWRHSEMPVGQVAYYLLNDLSDNEPYTRIATLEWTLQKVKEEALKTNGYFERQAMNEVLKLINSALRPAPMRPQSENRQPLSGLDAQAPD